MRKDKENPPDYTVPPSDEDYERRKRVFAQLGEYVGVIETLRQFKRPMLLWAVLSLVYVYGDLHFTSGHVAAWGVQMDGITEWELSVFLWLAILYYAVKWAWKNWVQLRAYWRDGYLTDLWKCLSRPAAEWTGVYYEYGKGFNEEADKDPTLAAGKDDHISQIVGDRTLRGTVEDLSRASRWFAFIRFTEHFGAPFIFPALVALWALGSLLWCRIL